MSDDKTKTGVEVSVLVYCLIVAMSVTCVVFATILDATSETRRFDSICTYLDGKVQGDVCIKDGEIIETIDAAQDPPRD